MPMRRSLVCAAAMLGGVSALAPIVPADKADALAPKAAASAESKVSFTVPKEATNLVAARAIGSSAIKNIQERDRRTAYEWAEFLGFAPFVDCTKLEDTKGTVPFFEATLGTGAPGGVLGKQPYLTVGGARGG